jgi:hypothetical protein
MEHPLQSLQPSSHFRRMSPLPAHGRLVRQRVRAVFSVHHGSWAVRFTLDVLLN